MGQPTLGELAIRVSAIEERMRELDELVDGQEPWSHRKRLHVLEGNDRGVELAAEALKAYRQTRASHWTQIREWGAFTLATVAILRPWEW